MDVRGLAKDLRFRAFGGALVLHIALFGLLLTWRPSLLPTPAQTIPIILVELPPEAPEIRPPPEIEIEPELPPVLDPPETTPDFIPAPEPRPEPVETERVADKPQPEEAPAPLQEPPETTLERAPAAPAGVTLAPRIEAEQAPSQAATSDIPPQYVYKFDPFAETAPTALARTVVAVNCARANRETRPAFCPDYDEDELLVQAFAGGRPSEWEQAYNPVQDIAVARAELGGSVVARFQERQQKPQFTGRSESFGRAHPHDPILPDRDCRRVSVGFNDPFALDGNAAVPENTAVFCSQSLAD